MKSEPGWTWKWLRSPRHHICLTPPPGGSHRPMSANPLGVFCGIPQCKHWPLITCLGRVSGWLNTPVRTGPDFTLLSWRVQENMLFPPDMTWGVRFLVTIQRTKYTNIQVYFFLHIIFLDATRSCRYGPQDSYFYASVGLKPCNQWMVHSMLLLVCPILLCTRYGCWLHKGRVTGVTNSSMASVSGGNYQKCTVMQCNVSEPMQ